MAQGLKSFVMVSFVVVTGCPKEPAPVQQHVSAQELVATREALLARREGDLAQRESLLAVREHALAIRDEAVARRESVAGLTQAERDRLTSDARAVRDRVTSTLAARGLELRDADPSLRGHLEQGDALFAARDYTAAKLSYSAAEAFAFGASLDENRLRARLAEAQEALQSSALAAGEKARLSQVLLVARGKMADRAYKESLSLIKQVEDAAAPSDARKPRP